MTTSKVLTKDLMKLMDDYVAKDKNSCATLARESGVPYSTVVRLLKGGNVPSFESVFPILLTIQNYKNALAFVKKHYPFISNYLSSKDMATSFSKKAVRTVKSPATAAKKAAASKSIRGKKKSRR